MKKFDYQNIKSKIDYNNETKKVRRQVKQQKSQKTPQHQSLSSSGPSRNQTITPKKHHKATKTLTQACKHAYKNQR